MEALTNLLKYLKEEKVMVSDLEIQHTKVEGIQEIGAMMTLTLCEKCSHKLTLAKLAEIEGIKFLEEIF